VVNRNQILAFAVALAAVGALRAQQAGSLRGSVYDKDFDAPLAGATVQIVENGLKAETNDQGAFVFQQLPPGRYTVLARPADRVALRPRRRLHRPGGVRRQGQPPARHRQ
jgi:hypothetical protein